MLKIENTKFKEKFTEINIRQRMYEEKSIITLIVNTEFYPELVNDGIVSGNIEIKLDIQDISSIDELIGKIYEGEVGKVTISVNNDGVWEHDSKDNFKVSIISRKGRELEFSLETDNCNLFTRGVLVSLYTTSSDEEKIKNGFDLSEFYDKAIIKEIGNSKIIKYYAKN